MKTIAMTMEVYDDTDIFELHEELIEQFGETSELCIYESVDAMLRERFEIRGCWTQDGDVQSWPLGIGPNGIPEFYGIYRNDADGTQTWVADFDELLDAQTCLTTITTTKEN